MQNPLFRRLAEIVVIIGADCDSKYQCKALGETELSVEFQPSVLATITEAKAVYPNVYPNVNFDYPPKWLNDRATTTDHVNVRQQSTLPSHEDALLLDALVINNQINTKNRLKDAWITAVDHSIGGERHLKKHKSVKKMSRSAPCAEPRVTYETIEGLPSYCFSNYIAFSQIATPNKVIYLPLTDIKGGRLYAVGITCSRYFEDMVIVPADEERPSVRQSGYLPCIVFIISQQSFFNTLRDILSTFVRNLSKDCDFYLAAEELAAIVTNTPILKSEDTILEFNALGGNFKIWPQFSVFEQTIDFDLVLLFQLLSVDDIIKLVISLLLQRRIVFMSQLCTLSALSCESLLMLISPFKWKFTCVPYLPQKLYDLLDAPGPFLYGCESSNIDLSEYASDIIVVDLDTRKVKYPDQNLPLPRHGALAGLKSALNFPFLSFEQYNLGFVDECNLSSYNDKKHFYYANMTRHILNSFMEFMVYSFRDVLIYIKTQENKPSFFNSDGFLKSQKEAKEFYHNFLKTELFDSFLRDRFRNKRDAWRKFEEKMRKHSLLTRIHNSSFSNSHPSLLRADSPVIKKSTELLHATLTFEALCDPEISNYSSFKLPSFMDSESGFIERLMNKATKLLDSSKLSRSMQASILKLLIDLKHAVGKKEEAIEYVYRLSKVDFHLVDQSETIKILNGLSIIEEMRCKNQSCFDAVKGLVHFEDQYPTDEMPARIQKKISFPASPINIDEFLLLVDHAGISTNMRVQEQLFEALSMDHRNKNQFRQVSADTFKTFYKAWSNIGLTDLDEDMDISEFMEDEVILKLTREQIRIDPIGYGHLILTQKRLLGIISGSLKHLINLIEITHITETDYWTKGFGRYKSIKVSNKTATDDQTGVFSLALKQESDAWKCILNEMTCGQRIARQTKDQSYVGVAMDECFILDTIWTCQEDSAYFNKYLTDINKCFNTFTTAFQTKEFVLDSFTRRTLKRKFQPAFLTSLESVESLICVPRSTHPQHSELWCAVTSQRSSKLIIFDASTFEFVGYVSQLQDKKAMCLIHAPINKTVWAGCQDNTIYIIKLEDRTVMQQLQGHKDLILSFAIHSSECVMASGSSLGNVITWDVLERSKKKMWSLGSKCGVNEMHFYNDFLFCCSRLGVWAFDEEGILVETFKFDNDLTSESLNDSILFQSGNNPVMECFRIDNDFMYVGMSRPAFLLVFALSPSSLSKSNNVLKYPVVELCTTVAPCKKCLPGFRCSLCLAAEKCRGISRLLINEALIWLCCKNGNIFIYNLQEGGIIQRLTAHKNASILSICKDPFSSCVFTGGRTPDSKIAAWDCSVLKRDFNSISNTSILESSCSSTVSSVPSVSSGVPSPPSPPPRTKALSYSQFYQ